jgi:hypothetical protein
METTNEKLAYCGGIMDGEGSIGVQVAKVGGFRRTPSFRIRLRVAMCDKEAVFLYKELFGGKVRYVKKKNIKHRSVYEWNLRSFNAVSALKELLPYLLVKKERAILAIELGERVSSNKMTTKGIFGLVRTPNEEVEIRRSLYLKIKKLNERGVK